jgi:3-deoxy-D-manno-octulosonic acid kinase
LGGYAFSDGARWNVGFGKTKRIFSISATDGMAGSTDIVFINPHFSDLPDSLKQVIFEPQLLKEAGLLIKELRGRGATYFFKLREDRCVLRHYWRGGSARHFSKDRYVWMGLKRTRSFREWKLLEQLESLSLPAPRRIALRIIRTGLFYRSDIVTKEIQDSVSLSATLKVEDLEKSVWMRIGRMIRLFHDHNVYHQDLNASNILLTLQYCYLIDFDRGRIDAGNGWKAGTLNRLKRSLEKFATNETTFHYDPGKWMSLMDGYQQVD